MGNTAPGVQNAHAAAAACTRGRGIGGVRFSTVNDIADGHTVNAIFINNRILFLYVHKYRIHYTSGSQAMGLKPTFGESREIYVFKSCMM